ncbi:MAG: ATP-binding cassette domain-containing protein [Spirochaetia bacterium]|nr:ATP-binding cassette domain-containing protein [Spirochaetia bacterium]
MKNDNILEVRDLNKHFLMKKSLIKDRQVFVKAVNNISFDVKRGQTLGVVGESGCGKSTLGKTILRLWEPTSGTITFNGENIVDYDGEKIRSLRKDMQYIFQDPYSSMNPKMTIRDIIMEPLDNFRKELSTKEKEEIVVSLLEIVGLSKNEMNRYPHEFSGGQRQRIVIARGISLNPKFLVCDESVSALDVSVQAQIINLLVELKKRFNLTYMFISHDLRVVKFISDRIMVLYLGEVMEIADSNELFANPRHPYTKSLIGSISKGNPRVKNPRVILEGEIPNAMNAPIGCPFSTRCPIATQKCHVEKPLLREVDSNHLASCFYA